MEKDTKRKTEQNLWAKAALVSSAIYIVWRIFYTIPAREGNVALAAGTVLLLAELMGILESAGHYCGGWKAKEPELPVIPDSWYPDVDLLIATHNESEDLLFKTVNGCKFLKYPDKEKIHIYICDDGNRSEIRKLADRMGVGYLGLKDNRHAKAGNLNHGLSKTNSPLVATFDADMIPMSDFLLKTVPYFFLPRLKKEEGISKIGFIQTPQSFYNPDLFQFNLYSERDMANEQDYFFRTVNVGRNRTNTPVYAGSNTVISREALEEVGGIRQGTVTEDFATGIDIQAKGYTCYATGTPLAHGLSPTSLKNLIRQRIRWGRGCVHTLQSREFLFGNLPFAGKISYLQCLLYWWTFFRRLIYILSPILFAVFGIQMVVCSLEELLLIWLPFHLITLKAHTVLMGPVWSQWWSCIVDTIIFPYLIIPVLAETVGMKQTEFAVTDKQKRVGADSALWYAFPHMLLIAGSLWGLYRCINRWDETAFGAGMVLVYWLSVNLYFLIMAVCFLHGRENKRQEERICAAENVDVTVAGEKETDLWCPAAGNRERGRQQCEDSCRPLAGTGVTADLSESGMAVLLDVPLAVSVGALAEIRIKTADYSAKLTGKLVHVVQTEKAWKYSFSLEQIPEKEKAQYYAIIYDRDHTMQVSERPGAVKKLWENIEARKQFCTFPVNGGKIKGEKKEVSST